MCSRGMQSIMMTWRVVWADNIRDATMYKPYNGTGVTFTSSMSSSSLNRKASYILAAVCLGTML